MPHPGGRPTKLDSRIQEKIVQAIRGGNYTETAASYAGIHKTTLYDWLKRGERETQRLLANPKAKMKKSERPYVEFSDAVEEAMTDSEMVALSLIAQSKDWKSHAWRLERRFPQRWGKSDKLQLEGSLDHTHEGEVTHKHDLFADIDQYADVIRKASEGRSLPEGDAGTDNPQE